jgi:hypothetical protein
MNKKISLLVMLVSLLVLGLVFGSCDNGTSSDTKAPTLTRVTSITGDPSKSEPQWTAKSVFSQGEEISIKIEGTDKDTNIKKIVTTIKKDGVALTDSWNPSEDDVTIDASPFTYYIGFWTFGTAGTYSADVYAVDADENKSNTATVNFTVK